MQIINILLSQIFGYTDDFEIDSTNTRSSVKTLTRGGETTDQCAVLATSNDGGSVWFGDHVVS